VFERTGADAMKTARLLAIALALGLLSGCLARAAVDTVGTVAKVGTTAVGTTAKVATGTVRLGARGRNVRISNIYEDLNRTDYTARTPDGQKYNCAIIEIDGELSDAVCAPI